MKFNELDGFSDQQIVQRAKALAAEERRITAEIIRLLEEVDRRKIFATLGYSSLFDFATRELGYSAASAQRRIMSMRVLHQIPDVENKILDGSLNLTNVAQAQRFFKVEEKNNKPLSLEEKKAVLEKLEGKSTREAEKELIGRSSNPIQFVPERIKPVSPDHSQVQFVADQNLLDKLDEIRGLLAHQKSDLSLSELISEVTEIALKALKKKKYQLKEKEESEKFNAEVKQEKTAFGAEEKNTQPESSKKEHTRYIPSEVKRAVYQRDLGKCTYEDKISGRRCRSGFGIEFEHLKPFSYDGENTVRNIVLRCKNHNLLSAAQIFGKEKILKHSRYYADQG